MKTELDKPALICFYGYPGSGKSYVARNLSTALKIAHVSADRIRGELFKEPRYDAKENAIVHHLMNYMASEFLDAGVSVAYDANATREGQRRALKELANKHRAEFLLVWLQVDAESAFARTQTRDRRTSDDRFAQPHTQQSFDAYLATMQNPQGSDYIVISGKHSFTTQKNAVLNRLFQRGLVGAETVKQNVAKPELINLIPNTYFTGLENERRNISIS